LRQATPADRRESTGKRTADRGRGSMSDTIHRMVTERMIGALERGTVPWHKPWQAADGRPTSMTTGQPYRGVNVFLLGLTAADEGYRSRYWGTYQQITQLGGQVRRGEHSTLVVFWKPIEVSDRNPHTGEVTVKHVPVLRYYRVFNATQADHLPDPFDPAPKQQDTQIAEPQTVLDGYLASGPALRHVAGGRAAYQPASDTIRLPLRSQFQSAEHYYATAYHEAAHSTGHQSRLNRPGIVAFDHFGTDRYAREELVAEMTSSILCAETGIDNPELFDNSAAYITSWLSALNNDRTLVVAAAAQAQRACDLINQAERQAIRDARDRPEVATVADPRDANDRQTSHVTQAIEKECAPAGPTARTGPTDRTGDWDAEAS
jgi:antirestriction protein ArdC